MSKVSDFAIQGMKSVPTQIQFFGSMLQATAVWRGRSCNAGALTRDCSTLAHDNASQHDPVHLSSTILLPSRPDPIQVSSS